MGAPQVCRASQLPAFSSRPAVKLGARVRVWFGTESREGTVEHISEGDEAHVRMSPGWVHLERVSRLEVL